MIKIQSTRGACIAALAIGILCGCAGMTPVSAPISATAAKAELAPTGSLRVAVFTGNPLIGSRDKKSGEVTGITVTLARSLAERVGVPVTVVEYTAVSKVVEGASTGAWDIAVLGVDPARRNVIDYAPPHLTVDMTYLIAPGSTIRSVADADRPGVRIAAARGGIPAIVLERTLGRATLVVAENEPAAFEMLRAGKVQAIAQNRSLLLDLAESLPNAHVLDDRLLAAELALALPKARPAALAYVSQFIEQAKASGAVSRAVESAGVRGVNVAPAARL
jgi:polar amino acid transport system substrate-binding protein